MIIVHAIHRLDEKIGTVEDLDERDAERHIATGVARPATDAEITAWATALVDAAIASGKIAASQRGQWMLLVTGDPGMADVLAARPSETAVPVTAP